MHYFSCRRAQCAYRFYDYFGSPVSTDWFYLIKSFELVKEWLCMFVYPHLGDICRVKNRPRKSLKEERRKSPKSMEEKTQLKSLLRVQKGAHAHYTTTMQLDILVSNMHFTWSISENCPENDVFGTYFQLWAGSNHD